VIRPARPSLAEVPLADLSLLLGSAGERPADLVLDLVEVYGGAEGRQAHRVGSRANGNLEV
jgi:hypothetical protein